MLQPGARHHGRVAMLSREGGEAGDGAVDIRQQRVDRGAQAQHGRGVAHVLAGAAPMPIPRRARGGFVTGGGKRFPQRDREVAGPRGGNLALPLVKALTAAVNKADADAARYVHWGATSQDVIDTAAMLTLRAAIDALLPDIDRAIAGFAKLARRHPDTPVVARTMFQHPLPMPS